MDEEEVAARKEIPIEWIIPEDTVTRYASNMVVQHTESEFIISFFETQPPIILGTPDEAEALMSQLRSVRAKCVARVVVSPKRMEEFITVLQNNLAKYQERQAGEGA